MKAILMASVFAAVALHSGVVKADSKDLVGTWSLLSSNIEKDGTKTETFGSNPKGGVIFGPDGHFALVFMRGDLPKVASNNRVVVTPEEAKVIATGLVGTFGTYTADNKFITMHIVGATFANWTGVDQKREYTLTGDKLVYTSPGTTGVPTIVTLQRVK